MSRSLLSDDDLAALIPGWFAGIRPAEYSRLIGAFMPLTRDVEATLIKQLHAASSGRISMTGDSAVLAGDLQELIQIGEDAKAALVRANLKAVVSIAKEYADVDLPLMTLVRAGNTGLIRAAEACVRAAGPCRFSAFCRSWIRRAIEDALPATEL